jgi:2-polyprenyl-3-methyl-5-hydroxy-6-metoxy-1,4-benzoquinol methylase
MGEVYNNGRIRVKDIENCSLCLSKGDMVYENLVDRIFGVGGTWNFMRCPRCALIWISPRAIPGDIEKLYTNYYTHEGFPGKEAVHAPNMYIERIHSLLRSLGRGLITYLERSKPGHLLDVGCGNGDFLFRMRNLQWEVTGIDSDPGAVKFARQRYGLNVLQGNLMSVHLPQDSFDAITMNHVIEHVADPDGLLYECKRLLKDDGIILVATPNSESLGSKIFESAWVHWDPPRHLYVFCAETLGTCAKKSGVRILDVRTNINDAGLIYRASSVIKLKNKVSMADVNSLPPYDNIKAILFVLAEYLLLRIRRYGGEELIMKLGK